MNDSVSQINKIDDFAQRINAIMVYLSGGALAFMSLMIVADVLLRFVLNAPLKATVEISQLIEPYVVFLPFAYTLAKGRHVRVTLLTNRLSETAQMFTESFIYIIAIIFFSLLCCYSWLEFWQSFKIGEVMLAAIRLPWWAGKLAMPIGMFAITIQCILLLLLTASKIKGARS